MLACVVALVFGDPSQAQSQEPPAKPEKVIIGLYVNDIRQLEFGTHSFLVDYYIWLRWDDAEAKPYETLEQMNSYDGTSVTVTELMDHPRKLADGTFYYASRHQGRFSNKFDLSLFPFDTQTLKIIFEDDGSDVTYLAYAADKDPVTINSQITLPGYNVGKPSLDITENLYPTSFGDTEVSSPAPFSRVTVNIPVARPTLTFAMKVLLPIALVTACSGFLYWIRPLHAGDRMGLGVTLLLTLVALQISGNAMLPNVDYLMIVDWIYIGAFFLVITSFAHAIRGSWYAFPEEEEAATRDDRKAFVLTAVMYAIVFLAVPAWFLLT